jgi:hypothetical protein
MRLSEIRRDAWGATAVEFGLTGPIFFTVAMDASGVAARSRNGRALCHRQRWCLPSTSASTSAIQTYAAQQSFGLNPAASNFTVSTPACGNQVSASYSFPFAAYFPTPSLALSAQACFPKPVCS